ncbi:transmembrane signal receptor [Lithospermum erythrorhizon]|uniref:Transmembrane signal receptor n=1 Tax=Lithospermum erythrorhizon TaxID=34254 RepID=A0AAV3NXP5_LITER
MSNGTKGYRLYNTETQKIIVSRDVIFEENKSWNWNIDGDQAANEEFEWEDVNIGEPVTNQEADLTNENPNNGGEPITNQGTDLIDEDPDNSDQQEESDNVPDNNIANEEELEQRRDELPQGRIRRPPRWMSDYVNLVQGTTEEDPIHFDEAVKYKKWRVAMDAEIQSIVKNKTWSLTKLPKNGKKIGMKWIYKTKKDENGNVIKHKARLVAKGYVQKEGIDYSEVFAPVARMDIVRMILSIAANQGWMVHQLDVKSAFLHGELIEEVFIEQPRGYLKKGDEDLVYKLHKALYGLKQAPRAWFSRIERHFLSEGF